MAFCTSWIVHYQSQNLLFLLPSFIILIFFSTIIPSATPLSFKFSSFSPNDRDIKYNGSASASSSVIQLTTNQRDKPPTESVGHATYASPLQLWDRASRNLTDFTTHFSFVIDSQNNSNYGDGFAFFLAPTDSQLSLNIGGGALGLARADQLFNSTDNPFVAVEFDIYKNAWDPDYMPLSDHVGIDINSIKSAINVSWQSNVKEGKKNDAWISYNSSSKNLSVVVVTEVSNNITSRQSLYHVVDLRNLLPDRVTFGFSASTGLSSAILNIYTWDFNSTLQIGENKTNQTPPASVVPTEASLPLSPIPEPTKRNKTGLVVGLSCGAGVLVAGLGLAWFGLWKKRSTRKTEEDDPIFNEAIDDDFEKGTGPRKFSNDELACATNNFADEEKLGEGGFGGVYKGFFRNLDSYVAVKRVSKSSKQGIKEYASEVKIISQLRHRNLVQLIGWCHEKRELLLVYEFMPNGSLDSHLFKQKSILTWAMRYKIAQGLASALLYLHEEWDQCVVHRDIKSSNIMLDSNFTAKLGDFGLARLVDHGKGAQTTVLAGTLGYMAPECVSTGRASKESDVFSFGVVALEIACGRRTIDFQAKEGQVRMVEWVWELYGRGMILTAADPRLHTDFDEQEMECLMIVGLWCAHPDQNLRPSIRQAIQSLNLEAPLPTLASKMPIATYLVPPMNVSGSSVSASHGATTEKAQAESLSYNCHTDSSKCTKSSAASSPSASLLYTR